ncbi:D-alanyl-lipoteichoic acid acyltransferase DltB, MBOAT superfamily [Pseudomonas asturiensis]|uniref:Probable alginate O-acetylase n=2 Tax=Pseudomonas syringae group TaxID=136849 RepID=A0A1M7Q7B0_9PSED|nr:MBOAT family O-acyltransferase [Pseudomonas asturiensis]SHN26442.1 D-alanyl-lipoteichoic acid acyltransferase DltB, MBOAT superfamily [Pseudomonas asturiensis]
MIFSSYAFLLVFFPLVYLLFLVLRAWRLERAALAMLVVASLVFYGMWSWKYLGLLLGLIVINFVLGKQQVRHRAQAKVWLIVAVVFNLSVLAYFKYAGFFLGFLPESATWHIILPLGISFFTFQKIAWHVDLYQRRLPDTGTVLQYSFFVCFFPQLIAGPIVHARTLFPQISAGWFNRPLTWQLGLCLLTLGLMKKVLLADPLAPGVAMLFDSAQAGHALSAPEVLLAGLSYGLQLYFDFSGYADMAIGLGLMFGIKLPANFRSPYKSASIVEFWRRWHITLSGFLRDYLYIPLGGNRHGRLRANGNLLITMLLGGLWHGAGWQFILWGGVHGALLVINHYWRHLSRWRLPRLIAVPLTLLVVMLAWIPFRADSLTTSLHMFQGLTDWRLGGAFDLSQLLTEVATMQVVKTLPWVCAALLVLVLVTPGSRRLSLKLGATGRGVLVAVGLFMVLKALAGAPDRAFLYFNF